MPYGPKDNLVFGYKDETYEIFSFAAEARSKALGALPAGSVKMFDTRHEIDLKKTPFSFNATHYSHSRQFRSNIVDEWAYWKQVIDDCQLSK